MTCRNPARKAHTLPERPSAQFLEDARIGQAHGALHSPTPCLFQKITPFAGCDSEHEPER